MQVALEAQLGLFLRRGVSQNVEVKIGIPVNAN